MSTFCYYILPEGSFGRRLVGCYLSIYFDFGFGELVGLLDLVLDFIEVFASNEK